MSLFWIEWDYLYLVTCEQALKSFDNYNSLTARQCLNQLDCVTKTLLEKHLCKVQNVKNFTAF